VSDLPWHWHGLGLWQIAVTEPFPRPPGEMGQVCLLHSGLQKKGANVGRPEEGEAIGGKFPEEC
jgi:hypothetical protein